MEASDLIAVGEIVKTQGVKGELKVLPLTENPDRFSQIRRVFFEGSQGWQELRIQSYRMFKGFALLKFEGVDNMTAADSLGRGPIYIPKRERPPLPAGRYYQDEILGLRVYTETGELLGVVDQIIQTGANDVYSIKRDTAPLLIPALQSVIRHIDLTEGKMVVELPAGLTEDL